MIKSYFTIAIRNLLKQWSYTLINVFGLMVGIAAFILIALFIQHHLSFDKHIPDVDQFYRVVQIQQAHGIGEQHVAINMGPLTESAVQDIPEVIDAVRVMSWGTQNIRVGEQYYSQQHIVWTDPSVFRLFGIRLLIGDTATALDDINKMVLSETTALKFFNSIEDAVGQVVEFNNEPGYLITGVMEDQPRNAHMWMEVLVSYKSALQTYPWLATWYSNSMCSYVKLEKGTDPNLAAEKLNNMLLNYFDPDIARPQTLYLQPVSDVHLHSNHIKFQVNYQQGNSRLILVFAVVALLIILIACINFINLAIARSVKRAKEVGVRKVMGANRNNLIYQFLGESLMITLAAILLSVVLVEITMPEFNKLLGTELNLHFFGNPVFNVGLVLIWLFVSLMSGVYPAIFMSRYKAVEVLKGSGGQSAKAKGWLGKSLVVFQFSIAIILIFVVIVTNRQVSFVLNKDLGYDYENVLGVQLQGGDVAQKAELLRARLNQMPGIGMVAASSFINGVSGTQSEITVDDTNSQRITVRYGFVDEDFFPLMGIQLVAGRNFSRDYPNDENESVILNEAAVAYLGWDQPLGKRFMPTGMDTDNKKTVIGVINDYHYYSVHSRIEPAAYYLLPYRYGIMCVKYEGVSKDEIVSRIEEVWLELFPSLPFEVIVASERLERQYAADRNTLKVFMMFTILSILISALGLYGLTAINVEQRTREIGIRKVLGGSIGQLMMLIFKEFLMLVIIAGLIAIPLGYYFSGLFLEQFAYTIPISWYYAALALLTALTIAAATIIYHARHAAAINPIESLKYE
jgi:putative ABC transport system permease protein